MCAEALWILSGDDTVDGIAPYCRNIAQFSDDGKTYFGAYGPRIASQFEYIISVLVEHVDTRQAVLTIWRENPPESKDIPCTVSLTFNIRDGKLNCHVFMRSSDTWFGVPYDFFNFSMIAARVACVVNKRLEPLTADYRVELGTLYFTAVSSHLYQPNWEGALRVLAERRELIGHTKHAELGNHLIRGGCWDVIEAALVAGRTTNQQPRWPTELKAVPLSG
jgi:thymidylate synthase